MRWWWVLVLVGCSSAASEQPTTVFAAASLTDVLGAVGGARFHFAGSHQLVLQAEQGAPVDALVVAEMRPGATRVMCNEPVVVVPTRNPARVQGVRTLTRAKRLVVGVPEVPIGRHAAALLAGVEVRVASYALDARQVLAAVAMGEADAGIVYRTDARSTERVATVEVEPELRRRAVYGAQAFTPRGEAWLAKLRASGALLERHGFGCGADSQ